MIDDEPFCARCYGEGPLFTAKCKEKPEEMKDSGLGMYHCPDCGAMVLAGIEHMPLCELCVNGEHLSYDYEHE